MLVRSEEAGRRGGVFLSGEEVEPWVRKKEASMKDGVSPPGTRDEYRVEVCKLGAALLTLPSRDTFIVIPRTSQSCLS